MMILSFNLIAAEQIDLRKDAVYYCKVTAKSQINKNDSQRLRPDSLTLKVHDQTIVTTYSNNDKTTWLKTNTNLHKYSIFAGDLDNNFSLEKTSAGLTFNLYTSWRTDSSNSLRSYVMKISIGTCKIV